MELDFVAIRWRRNYKTAKMVVIDMTIEKKIEVKITLDAMELELLKQYMEWARVYAEEKKDTGKSFLLGYDSWQECRIDMEKVMHKIFEI